jgi:hypothetical protein
VGDVSIKPTPGDHFGGLIKEGGYMFELFKLIGLGLVLLLPLVNPLTTVALFLGLSGDMTEKEKRSSQPWQLFMSL